MPGKKVEIRSHEVQEILGQIPSWVTRWGTLVVFLVLFLLVIGSWFFKFPDVIQGQIVVTTMNPPTEIIARTNGKLDEIVVADKDSVTAGELLAAVHSTVVLTDYRFLKLTLDSLSDFIGDFDSTAITPGFLRELNLGDMQVEYSSFVKVLHEYRAFIQLTFYSQKVVSIQEQLSKYNLYYSRLWNQRQILEEEYNIALNQYSTDRGLYEKQAISKKDLDKSQSQMLAAKFKFEKARTDLADTKMKMQDVKQDIIDLRQKNTEKKKQYELEIRSAYDDLRRAMTDFDYNYLLKAPIDGRVSFTRIWSKNQNVTAGDKIFTLIPGNSGKLIGRIQLPVKGSGKVREGQKVIIRFDNYPYMDYGMVSGIVSNKSLVTDGNNYLVEVDFPKGLKTNYNTDLQFTSDLQGVAEIITENVRLIEKLINPVRALFKKQKSLE